MIEKRSPEFLKAWSNTAKVTMWKHCNARRDTAQARNSRGKISQGKLVYTSSVVQVWMRWRNWKETVQWQTTQQLQVRRDKEPYLGKHKQEKKSGVQCSKLHREGKREHYRGKNSQNKLKWDEINNLTWRKEEITRGLRYGALWGTATLHMEILKTFRLMDFCCTEAARSCFTLV